jgi:hypothetical protein
MIDAWSGLQQESGDSARECFGYGLQIYNYAAIRSRQALGKAFSRVGARIVSDIITRPNGT